MPAAFCVAVLLTLCGCVSVPRDTVVSWRDAVQAAKEQSTATFKMVGLLVRESQLNRIETLPPDKLKQITPDDISPGLPPAALRRWNLAFDDMAAYATAVQALLSPDLPKGVGNSLQRAGEQIGATANVEALKSDKELSNAIGALGRQIVAAAANRKAREVMLEVDPAIKRVTDQMANMLYATAQRTNDEGQTVVRESGVLPTLRVTWEDKITAVQEEFRDATQGAARRQLAEQYADLLDHEAQSEESILSLRQALLDLGAAHTAAAQGRAADLRQLVSAMREQATMLNAVAESLKTNKQPK